MNGTLYKCESPENYINKTINEGQSVTLHFKDDSSVQKPTIYISTAYDMRDYNYIHIPSMHRYYYIEDVTVSQQRYICKCRSDVLMSFKSYFLNEFILTERSGSNYSPNLEDDRSKAFQYIHIDTIPFEGGEGFDASKQEFLLAVCGNPNINASVTTPQSGKKPENNGGSGKQHSVMDEQEYEDTTSEEKKNVIIVVPENNVGSSYNMDTLYSYIKESQYNNLTQAEQENGTMYFLGDHANGTYGTRNIQISAATYAELTNSAKNNSTPYYVR